MAHSSTTTGQHHHRRLQTKSANSPSMECNREGQQDGVWTKCPIPDGVILGKLKVSRASKLSPCFGDFVLNYPLLADKSFKLSGYDGSPDGLVSESTSFPIGGEDIWSSRLLPSLHLCTIPNYREVKPVISD